MKTIRLVLQLVMAVALLLCLAKMPYGYYNIVRFAALVVFGYIGYTYMDERKPELGVAFFSLAVLFQPLVKIALGRTIWNVVDVVVAVGLIFLAAIEYKKKSDK